jgi:photosystem II stability/assembly factor-like uncharacterized protein
VFHKDPDPHAPNSAVRGTEPNTEVLGAAVYRTSDGGVTWKRQTLNSTEFRVFEIRCTGDREVLRLDQSTYGSHDGGGSWAPSSFFRTDGSPDDLSGHDDSQALAFVDDSVGWLSFDDGTMFTTVDGGRIWRNLPHGTTLDSSGQPTGLTKISFADRLHGWALGVGFPPVILRTSDGGRSWRNYAPGLEIWDYASVGNAGVWIATRDYVAKLGPEP